MLTYEEMGAILKDAREKRGMLQSEIASALGVTKQSVSQIEKGKTRPPLEKLDAYSRLVGVRLVVDMVSPDDERKMIAAAILERINDFPETVIDALSAWSERWSPQTEDNAVSKVG